MPIPGLLFPFPFSGLSAPTTWTFSASHPAGSGAVTANQTNMSDGLASTYYAPNTAAASWLEADFGDLRRVSSVRIADPAGNGGWTAAFLTPATLEWWDGTSWQTLSATLNGGHAGTGNLVTYTANVTTQRIRVRRADSWFGIGEFWFT